MIVNKIDSGILIQNCDADLNKLVSVVTIEFDKLKDDNLLIDLSNYKNLKPKDLNVFLPISKKIKSNKQSFVVIIEDFDFNKSSDKINVVPTLKEALDVIELENIERDLGF